MISHTLRFLVLLLFVSVPAATAQERTGVLVPDATASMVSFVMLFRLLGVVFLVMIPLVFILRRPKRGAAAVVAE